MIMRKCRNWALGRDQHVELAKKFPNDFAHPVALLLGDQAFAMARGKAKNASFELVEREGA